MEGPHPAPRLNATQLAALLERVPDIVWRYRLVPTAGFEYVSRSVFALTGYTPADHYGDAELGRKIVHPDDLSLMEAATAAPENHTVVVLRWRHKAGLELATEQRIVPIRDGTGRLVALEGVGRPLVHSARTFEVPAGDLVLDLASHRVLVSDRVVELTPSEHGILVLLASSAGPVRYADIIARLWGDNNPAGSRVLQVHVSNLRRKIEDDPAQPTRLLTRRGVGYELLT